MTSSFSFKWMRFEGAWFFNAAYPSNPASTHVLVSLSLDTKANLGKLTANQPIFLMRIDTGSHACSFTPSVFMATYKIGRACFANSAEGNHCTLLKALPWNTNNGGY